MSAITIAENIHWVGAVDWNLRTFHGNTYITRRGSTYNAYLIMDEKITLVDTVLPPFAKELVANIAEIIDPAKIDYIIANHVEMDHSGALPELLKLCPKAKVIGTARCRDGLQKYYNIAMDFQVVKTGDTLSLGRRTLRFIEAPMIHWPDSMFTYIIDDQILMPNDAFGQHYATSQRFDDEVDQCALMDEASKYYANILWPLSGIINTKLQEIQKMNLPIRMIAPSHGIIWRRDPGKIVSAYLHWSKNEARRKAVIAYETMWGSTAAMARRIADALTETGVEVKLFDVAKADHTVIANEMLEAKFFLFGSSTHDNDMLPLIASYLEFFKGLKPKGRAAAVFGSFGWGGGAIREIEGIVKEAGVELIQPSLGIKYAPGPEELQACYDFGKQLAQKI